MMNAIILKFQSHELEYLDSTHLTILFYVIYGKVRHLLSHGYTA